MESTTFRPWKTIWLQPKKTIHQALQRRTAWWFVLPLIANVFYTLDRASMKNMGDIRSIGEVIGYSIGVGLISGFLLVFLIPAVIFAGAKLLKGKGSYWNTVQAYSWATLSKVLLGLIWIPYLVLFGSEMFTTDMPTMESSTILRIVFFLLAVIEVILSIWTVAILCHAIAEVHHFSAWKGFFSCLMVVIIVLVLMLGLILLGT
ncbi:Yip1 family protein [Risungbinella massiliensis]|uniref:Yip1 family protein n=1 Tax=Risungbinella massiliensis TaxID=1329796 RepID=UPI0005CBD231|nr:Yip1 family protein [Risungbinella massiliensis]